MTTIVDQELDKWPDKFKAKEIHLVCIATGGLTTCDCAASTIGGMSQEREVWPLTKRVNRQGETGTFYPRFPLTVVPLLKWEDRPEPTDIGDFLRRSFRDVLKANRDYIKLKTLYIDLNGWGSYYPFDQARQIAEEILSGDPGIETIYFAPKAT
ncbi:hypothetical protein FEK30_07245 [Picosynechococcus sp. PCC 11901]|uniref:hypothetical protein n=1 Tax=Picosynechococcus sp. PCC 11901 TaxID=2579791 RepID=UPI0010FC3677|nr:hypothetical protein [Picosynechococcus sp. PCC 11901]QCS49245.1 hypothetical protein FEK30_07245 [Picosynechococcus sp. PCC 11901]